MSYAIVRKTFSYGYREAGPLCETHCKPQGGAAVGGQGCKGWFPEGGLMPLAVSRMYKSRFAERCSLMQLHPQLHRFAACSGFRIEVYLRHTPVHIKSVMYFSRKPANFKFYAIRPDGVVERDARPPILFTFLLFYFFTFHKEERYKNKKSPRNLRRNNREETPLWALTDSNRRPSACKADALNQLS